MPDRQVRAATAATNSLPIPVMPAQAGIQIALPGVSLYAALDSRFRGNDGGVRRWRFLPTDSSKEPHSADEPSSLGSFPRLLFADPLYFTRPGFRFLQTTGSSASRVSQALTCAWFRSPGDTAICWRRIQRRLSSVLNIGIPS